MQKLETHLPEHLVCSCFSLHLVQLVCFRTLASFSRTARGFLPICAVCATCAVLLFAPCLIVCDGATVALLLSLPSTSAFLHPPRFFPSSPCMPSSRVIYAGSSCSINPSLLFDLPSHSVSFPHSPVTSSRFRLIATAVFLPILTFFLCFFTPSLPCFPYTFGECDTMRSPPTHP